jgi:hypothetical protein
MSVAVGVLSLVIGLAYLTLAVIAGGELARHGRSRGFSQFGAALVAMGVTCGLHYCVHALHQFAGETAAAPLLASLLFGLIPGLLFVGLRVEATLGGRGDRLITGSLALPIIVPWLASAAGGAILWAAVVRARADGISVAVLVPNAILFANFTLVGIFTARTQLARRPLLGGWSLSGVAMSATFLSCGLAHLVVGLLTAPNLHTLTLDNLGVPASFYFLWVVHRLHRDALRDWNRRPLVGRAAPLGRASPWAAESST